jgi:hypothetical protein
MSATANCIGNKSAMRQFIRHPAGIPIHLSAGDQPDAEHSAYNVGVGGVALHADHMIDPGAIVHVSIPFVEPAFETEGRVAWCVAGGTGAEVGIEFLNRDDAFRARMVEQVCHIENYRNAVERTEGRVLTTEEAAAEWIAKYAARFPDPGSDDTR